MATHNGNQQGGVHFSGEAQEHGRAQRRTSQPQPARRRSAQQGQATRPKQAGTAGSTGSVRLANSQTGRVAQGARGTASKGGAVRQPKAASRQQASSHAASQGASRPQQRTQQRPTGTTRSARPVSAEARSARPSAGSTKATRPVSGATGAVRPVKAARPSQAVRTTPAVGAAHAAQPQAKARRNAPGKHAAPQKKNSYSRRAVVVTLVILAVVLAGGGFVARRYLLGDQIAPRTDVEPGQDVTIEIPDGASGRDVLNILLENGVITNGNDFNKAVQAQGAESSMKSGLYDFVTGSDASDVVKQLVAGPNSTKGQVTVAEGLTVQKTAETLSDQLGISQEDFLAQAKASNYSADYTFLSAAQDDSLEGFLFGKTYKLTKESPTADDAIRAMLDQYQSEVASLDFATAEATIKDQYGVTMTDYDVLTLASIIEKEALNDDDRVKIASVFYNRLKAGMALQSDATMGYWRPSRRRWHPQRPTTCTSGSRIPSTCSPRRTTSISTRSTAPALPSSLLCRGRDFCGERGSSRGLVAARCAGVRIDPVEHAGGKSSRRS